MASSNSGGSPYLAVVCYEMDVERTIASA